MAETHISKQIQSKLSNLLKIVYFFEYFL